MSVLVDLIKEDIPPHKHKNYEIIICTKGNGIINAAGKDIEITSGKIIIIPPETVHYSRKTSLEYERIYINGPFNHIFFLSAPIVISDNSENEGLLLSRMIYNNRFSTDEYIMSLVNAFAHFLLPAIKFENDIFLAVKSIAETIGNNFYDSNINIHNLLKESGYSTDYIRAHFKNIIKKTPTQFLTEIRINHACYLMAIYKNYFSLAEIAEKCGYSDYVYFSRKFKQIMGVSPKKYIETNL